MVLLSELQIKEVIDIKNGKRLGHIYDLNIHPTSGMIHEFIVISRERKGGVFGKVEEQAIQWRQIITIGIDVILVNISTESPLYLESHSSIY